jgi:uncharacterized protein GlcG (DUF336 family)
MSPARRWFSELAHGPRRSKRPNCAPRRLLMPERLEGRNAPGGLVPLMPSFGSSGSDWDADESENYTTSRRTDRAGALSPTPALTNSVDSFILALRAEEARERNSSSRPFEPQPPNDAVRDSIFGNEIGPMFVPVFFAVPVIDPPVIHPVEPGPEPETETPSGTGSDAIAVPTPTGSENSTPPAAPTAPPVSDPETPAIPDLPPVVSVDPVSVDPAPVVPTPVSEEGETESEPPAEPVNQVPADEPPPMIQPVITDPDSEHNPPSTEPPTEPVVAPPVEEPNGETASEAPTAPATQEPNEEPATAEETSEVPPPVIQPVIMDTDSEHNQPSAEPPSESVVVPAVEEPTVEMPIVEENSSEPPTGPVESDPVVTPTPATAEPVPVIVPAVVAPVAVASAVSSGSISVQSTPDQLSAAEVTTLLDRATRVTASNTAIIAIVDRSGRILGVHVEQGVLDAIPDMQTLVFAIDGAVAKARTAAFFSNNQAALTSRTVRFISQSTITQREVEANPNSTVDTIRGPGFVAPIGLGGHFPPDVAYTPPVDLFAIEHTNRDSLVHPGSDGIRQTVSVDAAGNVVAESGDDILLNTRFGADFALGKEIFAPESYGLVSGLMTNAQSRGIATLPGGVPLYKADPINGDINLVGGIGVFFPGADGYATHEQGFVQGINQTTQQRVNASQVIEAEYIATAIAKNAATFGGIPPVAGIGIPALPGGGRIDLGGITLESFGPHPYKLDSFLAMGQARFAPGSATGTRMQVNPGGDLAVAGEQVPTGWLVEPKAGSVFTAQQVEDIIERGIDEAEKVRAAIRLPLGTRTQMVLAVTDLDGEVLGLYRMDDATFFSIDVAVAKARNVVYYANPAEIKDVDRVDGNGDGTPDVAAGVAFTNRTFRYLAEPRFPAGIEGTVASPFSTLSTVGVNPKNAENLTGMTPLASDFTNVLGHDAFNPGTNFHEDLPSTGYQNGVVFFPGSTPLYNNTVLVGGFGVSGDGVDQDDVVTYFGAGEFLPGPTLSIVRADEVFVRGVRLPYQKFLRNPHG